MGLRVVNDVVAIEGSRTRTIDNLDQLASLQEAGTVSASAQVGDTIEVPTLNVNFETTSLDASHPITSGFTEPLRFFQARSLEVDGASFGTTTLSLAFSPDTHYGESAYGNYLETGEVTYSGDDTDRGALPLIAAYDDPTTGTRMVLIGDREFVTNDRGFLTSPPSSAGFVFPGNVRFTLRALAWLLDADAPELDFPTPGPTATVTQSPTPTITPTIDPNATEEPTRQRRNN
jgi:hypothetical protein